MFSLFSTQCSVLLYCVINAHWLWQLDLFTTRPIAWIPAFSWFERAMSCSCHHHRQAPPPLSFPTSQMLSHHWATLAIQYIQYSSHSPCLWLMSVCLQTSPLDDTTASGAGTILQPSILSPVSDLTVFSQGNPGLRARRAGETMPCCTEWHWGEGNCNSTCYMYMGAVVWRMC